MGIHNSGSYLYKFPDMGDKKNSLNSHIDGHIYGFPYIVAAFNVLLIRKIHVFSQVIRTIVSRCDQNIFLSLQKMLLHFHMNALDKSRLTHRFHDSGCSQD